MSSAELVLEVQQLAAEASPAALERLVAIGELTALPSLEAAVAANRTIIELAWGRPR
jgi:hypothetical protein